VIGALLCLCFVKENIQSSIAFSHSGLFSLFFIFFYFFAFNPTFYVAEQCHCPVSLFQLPEVTRSAPYFSANLWRVSYSYSFRKTSSIFPWK